MFWAILSWFIHKFIKGVSAGKSSGWDKDVFVSSSLGLKGGKEFVPVGL